MHGFLENFDDYCTAKKIDAEKFKAGDPELYARFAADFEAMHPNSFTEQKKFYINNIRRMYLLTAAEPSGPVAPPAPKRGAGPVIKRPEIN